MIDENEKGEIGARALWALWARRGRRYRHEIHTHSPDTLQPYTAEEIEKQQHYISRLSFLAWYHRAKQSGEVLNLPHKTHGGGSVADL